MNNDPNDNQIQQIRTALWRIQPKKPTFRTVALYLRVKVAGLAACNHAHEDPKALQRALRIGRLIGVRS